MKTLQIVAHPYLVIASFLLILISGEHFGGFYALYLLMALPHGGSHALAAIGGIALLIYSQIALKPDNLKYVRIMVNMVGVMLLFLSLTLFFYKDKAGYNDATFQQLVPQISLTLFVFICLLFIIRNLLPVFRKRLKQPVTGN